MKLKLTAILLCIVLAFAITGCSSSFKYESDNNVFNIDKIADISFVEKNGKTPTYIYGNGIVSADYCLNDGMITVKKQYLSTLSAGSYKYQVVSAKGKGEFEIVVVDNNRVNKIVNGDFESGDMTGWKTRTVFKGENNLLAFSSVTVKEDTLNKNDKYFALSGSDGKIGVMKSTSFVLGGSGYITFQLKGATNGALCYLSIKDFETEEEIARYSNSENQNDFVQYRANLKNYIGRKLYVEVCDYGIENGDFIAVDTIKTYHKTEPAGEMAIDIKPQFDDVVPTNQLNNGDFTNGLTGYTQIPFDALQNVYQIDNGVLKSDVNGDYSRGMLRSSLFKIDGSGIISLELGAGKGSKYDKNTYISIKEYKTNKEIFRFANRNSNGNEMITYYIDLSSYQNKYCYLEIIDNADGAWDVLFVKNIKTYYAVAPEYSFGNAGQNLNY